jgi:hypothetical protein
LDSSEYISDVLDPAVTRFINEAAAKDLAFSACILCFHYCEYAAKTFGKSKSYVEDYFRSASGAFNVVHAVATAAKHTKVDNKKLEHVGLGEADCMVATACAFDDGTYFDDGTSFTDHPLSIRVQTPDGQFHDLSFAVKILLEQIKEFELKNR